MAIIILTERREAVDVTSWLPSAFDSVSDAILIISKLKGEIYKRVTQGLSNCSKRVGDSRHSGCTRSSRAGWCWGILTEGTLCWGGGKHRVQFRTGTSSYEMALTGRSNGQTQSDNSPAGRLLGRNLACELKPGSTVFLRQRQTPHWDAPTRVWPARGTHKPFSSTLLQVRLVLGYGSPKMSPPAGHRGSHVADRGPGEHHL